MAPTGAHTLAVLLLLLHAAAIETQNKARAVPALTRQLPSKGELAAATAAPGAASFTVISYNVMHETGGPASSTDPVGRFSRLAALLLAKDADVVILQEVKKDSVPCAVCRVPCESSVLERLLRGAVVCCGVQCVTVV